MRGQPGFWDLDERYERISAVGDPLEKLNSVIPWPVFEKPLAKALKRSDGSKGGRPPFPAVLMFKIMLLQALYSLSDDQAEFVIQDRLSFMGFHGCLQQWRAVIRSVKCTVGPRLYRAAD